MWLQRDGVTVKRPTGDCWRLTRRQVSYLLVAPASSSVWDLHLVCFGNNVHSCTIHRGRVTDDVIYQLCASEPLDTCDSFSMICVTGSAVTSVVVTWSRKWVIYSTVGSHCLVGEWLLLWHIYAGMSVNLGWRLAQWLHKLRHKNKGYCFTTTVIIKPKHLPLSLLMVLNPSCWGGRSTIHHLWEVDSVSSVQLFRAYCIAHEIIGRCWL